jgi:hypothetical protein
VAGGAAGNSGREEVQVAIGEGFGKVDVQPAGALVILAWLARTDVVDDGASGDLGNGVSSGRRQTS